MADHAKTFSVMLRVRRVTYEDAYIAVPVTNKLMMEKADGSFGLDSDAFVAEALRMSYDHRVEWIIESSHQEPHPIQIPKPDERHAFDGAAHDTQQPPPR